MHLALQDANPLFHIIDRNRLQHNFLSLCCSLRAQDLRDEGFSAALAPLQCLSHLALEHAQPLSATGLRGALDCVPSIVKLKAHGLPMLMPGDVESMRRALACQGRTVQVGCSCQAWK